MSGNALGYRTLYVELWAWQFEVRQTKAEDESLTRFALTTQPFDPKSRTGKSTRRSARASFNFATHRRDHANGSATAARAATGRGGGGTKVKAPNQIFQRPVAQSARQTLSSEPRKRVLNSQGFLPTTLDKISEILEEEGGAIAQGTAPAQRPPPMTPQQVLQRLRRIFLTGPKDSNRSNLEALNTYRVDILLATLQKGVLATALQQRQQKPGVSNTRQRQSDGDVSDSGSTHGSSRSSNSSSSSNSARSTRAAAIAARAAEAKASDMSMAEMKYLLDGVDLDHFYSLYNVVMLPTRPAQDSAQSMELLSKVCGLLAARSCQSIHYHI